MFWNWARVARSRASSMSRGSSTVSTPYSVAARFLTTVAGSGPHRPRTVSRAASVESWAVGSACRYRSVVLAESCSAAEGALPELVGDWDGAFHNLYQKSPAIWDYRERRGHLCPSSVRVAFL